MDFNEAVVSVKKLKERPSDEELLQLYGLYKQATEGDNSRSKPWVDVKGRAKWDAWQQLKGMSEEEAKGLYVQLVEKLIQKYGM
ncbi:unnamed protein product [Thelazia callipaeda]|uniref:ACB domain-containing protein n=1 Tax=Thelazia callipaeda TaxID=103827 RepID=A0A0N5D6S3_THECL|nr:unnamed protein product [Thelazia callipaeda]